jgi:two-component system, chemotaxis family, protein-glutamate methylesterase/glutaminase
MEEHKIRVLVVDDASFMVKAVTEMLSSDPQIEVVGSARNGQEGLTKIGELQPDVITLDVDMPIMDGIKTVRHVMIESPVPVVILSSLFNDGAITFEALRLGVVDFLPKPSGAISQDIHQAKQQVIDRVKIAASVKIHNVHRVKLLGFDAREKLEERYAYQAMEYLVTIGTTLGGPNTVIRLLTNLSPRLPCAVVVVQEISPKIVESFCRKFDEFVPWKVEVAKDGVVIEQGTCYISSNEFTVTVFTNDVGEACLRVEANRIDYPLNALFASAANVFEGHTVGVLLTGVGDDGAEGFGQIREKSGTTIAQATDTCVYPNLTEYAIEQGTVDHVVDERDLAGQIEAAMSLERIV